MSPEQPQNPNHDFDFMLKDQPPARRGLTMPNLPRPALYGLVGVAVIILLIIVFSVISGRKGGNTQPIFGVVARNQETLRVTDLVQNQLQLQNPQTKALAATATASLSSDKQQLTAYLATSHTKLSAVQLAADADKATDSSLQAAAQNNGLDQAYVSYLRDALTRYQTDLKAAYQKAGPKGKAILQAAYDSAGAMLGSPPLKS